MLPLSIPTPAEPGRQGHTTGCVDLTVTWTSAVMDLCCLVTMDSGILQRSLPLFERPRSPSTTSCGGNALDVPIMFPLKGAPVALATDLPWLRTIPNDLPRSWQISWLRSLLRRMATSSWLSRRFCTTGGRSHGRGEEAGDHHTELPTEIRSRCTGIYNYVKRLHQSLGHPQPSVLKKMLTEVQAILDVLKAAEEYKCPACYHRKPPYSVPAAGLTARNFNDRVTADSAWIDTEDGRKCGVTFLDHATRYVAIRILKTERSEEFVKGLERGWIKAFGIPQILRVDGAKGWSSKYIREWCADRGIALEVARGETHTQLACPCGEETPGGQKGT